MSMQKIVTLLLLVLCITNIRAEKISNDSLIFNRTSSSKPVHKGEFMFGLSASHGKLSANNSSLFLLLDNINANGNVSTVNPSVGYFYSDHSVVGLRFKYSYANGELKTASLDLGSSNDIEFKVPYVDVRSNSFAYGLFQRSHAKLDKKGQFELFSELELLYTRGNTSITQDFSGNMETLRSRSNSYSINFNPGLAVYIFPNVASYVSLGLGGISYTQVKQYDGNGKYIGKRTASGLNLKINPLAINLGFAVHIW